MSSDTKRPDVADRLRSRHSQDNVVVKCSIAGKLLNSRLRNEIENWVQTTSMATHKASILFNHLLLHCLSSKIPLPDLNNQTLYLQCMNIGIGRVNKSSAIPVLQHVWNTYFHDFPIIEKQRGDTQAYCYAGRQYATNFKNSCFMNFIPRQKTYLRKYFEQNNIPTEYFKPIHYAINGWECKETFPEEYQEWIQSQRNILGQPENITEKWILQNIENVVHYFYFILQYLDQFDDVRKFTLAPVSRIKSHFLTIDSTVLFEMMKNVDLIKCSKPIFIDMKKEQWESVFNLSSVRHKGEFAYMVQTDGVSVCIHYHIPKRQEKTTGVKEYKKGHRVIGLDPGRCNLLYGIEKTDDGNIKKYQLKRSQYYTESGMKRAVLKTKSWEKEIEQEELIYRQVSLKTTSVAKYTEFLTNYKSIYTKLWGYKTLKKWGRSRFRVYRLKRKCLDKFFQSMCKKGEQRPTIAYGAAKFNPTNKNELSAPTTYLSRKCSRYYITVMVDEYNTTKMCNGCGNRLHGVKYPITTTEGKRSYREVRGLKWCSSTRCRNFLNRDKNAALNIRRIFMEGRPHCLSRNCSGRAKGKYSLLINQPLGVQDERKIMKSVSEEVIICQ